MIVHWFKRSLRNIFVKIESIIYAGTPRCAWPVHVIRESWSELYIKRVRHVHSIRFENEPVTVGIVIAKGYLFVENEEVLEPANQRSFYPRAVISVNDRYP